MKKEIEYIELYYTFDCGTDYEYRQYDGTDFVYKIDIEDAKYDILKAEIKKIETFDGNIYDVIDLFDNMFLWDTVIDEDAIEWLKDKYKWEAMEWFKDEHYIETEEDYEDRL